MSSAADRARATADRFRPPPGRGVEQPAPAEDDDELEGAAADARAARTARTRPVRGTYDLEPARYRAVGRWCDDAADELGEARITKQDVVATLFHVLLTDETMSRRVKAALPGVMAR